MVAIVFNRATGLFDRAPSSRAKFAYRPAQRSAEWHVFSTGTGYLLDEDYAAVRAWFEATDFDPWRVSNDGVVKVGQDDAAFAFKMRWC